MRILFCHGDYRPPGEGGGAESLLRDQAAGLKALGHECSWWYGEGTLEQALDAFDPDVLHFMTIHCYPMGLSPLVYAQQHAIPHLIHVQDYWPFCAGRMLLIGGDQSCSAVAGECGHECGEVADMREIVNGSYVVAGNAYTADIYRRNGLRCDRVVELGVDTTLFAPDHSQRTPEVSVWTHCAWPEQPTKGMHILRQAAAGIEVNLMAHVPREKIAAGLKRAHIHVFPSCYEETFGLCLCEAMASGCACIASDVAGAKAQIEDGVTGLIVPKRDPDALRAALLRLLDDADLRERLGHNAREHVAAEHSLEAMARRWEAAYEEVV